MILNQNELCPYAEIEGAEVAIMRLSLTFETKKIKSCVTNKFLQSVLN